MHPAISTSLVSPISKNPLVLSKDKTQMICEIDQLAFPIENGIPILLMERAISLSPSASSLVEKADKPDSSPAS